VAEVAPPDEAPELAAADAPRRRELKLVVSLRPSTTVGYGAVIALGAEGCDPLLRTTDVADLAGALEAVPGLLAEAEERWQLQPRYPTATSPMTRPAAANRASTSPQGPTRCEGPAPPVEPEQAPTSPPRPAPPSSQADQLTLFG
jgi:hypothetical protein